MHFRKMIGFYSLFCSKRMDRHHRDK